MSLQSVDSAKATFKRLQFFWLNHTQHAESNITGDVYPQMSLYGCTTVSPQCHFRSETPGDTATDRATCEPIHSQVQAEVGMHSAPLKCCVCVRM